MTEQQTPSTSFNPMTDFLFGFLCGFSLSWIAMSLRRNPPPPGRKPAPPAGPPDWRRSFNHENINPPTGEPPLKWRQREPAQPDPPPYGWGPNQLNPPPPAPGMRREWLWSPSQMAECGGPCWEAQDPRLCDCGALWRDVPIRLDEGTVQRGNGKGGPTTAKPPIKPQPTGGRQVGDLIKPEFPPPRKIREGFLE